MTTNGIPVGELSPLRRHRFVSAEAAVATFRGVPRVEFDRFRVDLDRVAGQETTPRAEAPRPSHGQIDTSVVIALENIDVGQLPSELAISALTMTKFAAGPHATGDAGERARRQDRPQRAEAAFDPAAV
ncbi:hypothetical protein [Mycobacterium sp.]|uniref:hypothetical protein n=1 Tax=Mycobacterium sp. TaxID=1785 RepID=UPI003F9D0699